jgi:hypothetical protein
VRQSKGPRTHGRSLTVAVRQLGQMVITKDSPSKAPRAESYAKPLGSRHTSLSPILVVTRKLPCFLPDILMMMSKQATGSLFSSCRA